MTRKPPDPIRVNTNCVMPNMDRDHVIIDDFASRVAVPIVDAPALIAALTALAREMGADVPDPVPVIEGLVDALELATPSYPDCTCTSCCAIASARAYLGKVKP